MQLRGDRFINGLRGGGWNNNDNNLRVANRNNNNPDNRNNNIGFRCAAEGPGAFLEGQVRPLARPALSPREKIPNLFPVRQFLSCLTKEK
jgi:hypothetical protein